MKLTRRGWLVVTIGWILTTFLLGYYLTDLVNLFWHAFNTICHIIAL